MTEQQAGRLGRGLFQMFCMLYLWNHIGASWWAMGGIWLGCAVISLSLQLASIDIKRKRQ